MLTHTLQKLISGMMIEDISLDHGKHGSLIKVNTHILEDERLQTRSPYTFGILILVGKYDMRKCPNKLSRQTIAGIKNNIPKVCTSRGYMHWSLLVRTTTSARFFSMVVV